MILKKIAALVLIVIEIVFVLSITQLIDSDWIKSILLFIIGFLTFMLLQPKEAVVAKKLEISEHKIIKKSEKIIGYYGDAKIHEWIEIDELGIFEFAGTTAINKYRVPPDMRSRYAILEPGILYRPVKENDTATAIN